MSAEMQVLFHGELPGKDAIQRVLQELEFPFAFADMTAPLDAQSGFMPMRFREEETGVEFDLWDGRDAVEDVWQFEEELDPALDRCAAFRWGGNFTEAVAGMCTAAALAKLVNGVVQDEYEDSPLDAEGAIRIARENLKALLQERGFAEA
jgi:hypothetical protein